MLVTFNTEDIPQDLNITEYVILFGLHHNLPVTYSEVQIKELERKRYLRLTDTIEIREKTRLMFTSSDEQDLILFLETFTHYPLKTHTGRALRPKGHDTTEGKKLFKKYKEKVISKKKHGYVLACLMRELETRKKANSIEYMTAMEVWINNEHWDRYADDDGPIQVERVDSI